MLKLQYSKCRNGARAGDTCTAHFLKALNESAAKLTVRTGSNIAKQNGGFS